MFYCHEEGSEDGYTSSYCNFIGVSGAIGFLNSLWLVFNIILVLFGYRRSWKNELAQQKGIAPKVAVVREGDKKGDVVVGEDVAQLVERGESSK